LPKNLSRLAEATLRPVILANSYSLSRGSICVLATLSRSLYFEGFIPAQQGENSAGGESFRRKLPEATEERAKTNLKISVRVWRKLDYV
jgi:hypothetical protein